MPCKLHEISGCNSCGRAALQRMVWNYYAISAPAEKKPESRKVTIGGGGNVFRGSMSMIARAELAEKRGR